VMVVTTPFEKRITLDLRRARVWTRWLKQLRRSQEGG
jgi:hypothetical protein